MRSCVSLTNRLTDDFFCSVVIFISFYFFSPLSRVCVAILVLGLIGTEDRRFLSFWSQEAMELQHKGLGAWMTW